MYNKKRLISEILEETKEMKVKDKVTHLKLNDTIPLRQLLAAAFHPSIEFEVEIPEVSHKKQIDGWAQNSLCSEFKRLYVFMKGSKATPKRRKEILGQILESIDPKDAELLERVIAKDLTEYGITSEVVDLAFPGILPRKK